MTVDPLRDGETVKEALDRCIAIADECRSRTAEHPNRVAREFSLAITAMEDAQMRYARGRAIQDGKFAPADLDRPADTTAQFQGLKPYTAPK